MKIRARLLGGFLIVTLLSSLMGLYAITVIHRSSAMTVQIYDKTLMASSFAMNAMIDFSHEDRVVTGAASASATPVLKDLQKRIAPHRAGLLEDLKIVEERPSAPDTAQKIADIKKLIDAWDQKVQKIPTNSKEDNAEFLRSKDKLRDQIEGKIDILVEDSKAAGLDFRSDAQAVGDFSFYMMLGAVGFTVLSGIVIALMIARSIGVPIQAITRTMSQLAQGERDIEIPGLGRRDEVAEMARAVEVFKRQADAAAELDLVQRETHAVQRARSEQMTQFALAFDTDVRGVIDGVAGASAFLTSTAEGVSNVVRETQRQAEAANYASETATGSVQMVAAATEELAASIAEISRQVEYSAEIAHEAVTQAEETNTTVRSLTDAAQQIGNVVQLIQTIASQTNLLALNATIEAARAGEAGRGFAVVANEVKSLATQTASATDEIARQVESIRSVTRGAVVAIESIGGTIMKLNDIGREIAVSIGEQGAATREIARNVQQAAMGTSEVNANIGGVMAVSGSGRAAADEVLASAQGLSSQADQLRHHVNIFLGRIRTV